jgi:MerR family transcriptional regulator, light-induced transcriptional regulator
MPTYSIKDLEKLSGIKAHTIRIWEQRYHFIEPKRTPTNIRYYSDDDLVKLMNTSLLNGHGYKISTIVQLNDREIKELILKLNIGETSLTIETANLVKALLEVDELLFNQVFEVSVEKMGFGTTMEQLLFPFLEKIGILWLAGTICPAQEHFISNLIRQKLIVAIDQERIRTESKRPRILFYLPEGEFHDIGLLYYNYLARKANFEVIYLGASVPFRDIIKMDDIRPFQLIFTSYVLSLGEGTLAQRIEKKRKAFPNKIFLISGWQIKQEHPYLPRNFFKISSSADLKKALDYFLKKENQKI